MKNDPFQNAGVITLYTECINDANKCLRLSSTHLITLFHIYFAKTISIYAASEYNTFVEIFIQVNWNELIHGQHMC